MSVAAISAGVGGIEVTPAGPLKLSVPTPVSNPKSIVVALFLMSIKFVINATWGNTVPVVALRIGVHHACPAEGSVVAKIDEDSLRLGRSDKTGAKNHCHHKTSNQFKTHCDLHESLLVVWSRGQSEPTNDVAYYFL